MCAHKLVIAQTEHDAESVGRLDWKFFWKARGDYLELTEAEIACVFKKIYKTTALR
jgi:hypothetical protein